MKEADLRFKDYISDAALWIDYLENDERFSEVIVLGHSEGALVGMVAAQDHPVSKFISLAGVAKPANIVIRKQLENLPLSIQQKAIPILSKLEDGERVEDIPDELYSLFRPDVQPYLMSWFKYDPQKELAKLEIPILVIQGTTDIQVDVNNVALLIEANERAQGEIIEGMNHILKNSELDRQKNLLTYNDPDLPLSDGLIDVLTRFIR